MATHPFLGSDEHVDNITSPKQFPNTFQTFGQIATLLKTFCFHRHALLDHYGDYSWVHGVTCTRPAPMDARYAPVTMGTTDYFWKPLGNLLGEFLSARSRPDIRVHLVIPHSETLRQSLSGSFVLEGYPGTSWTLDARRFRRRFTPTPVRVRLTYPNELGNTVTTNAHTPLRVHLVTLQRRTCGGRVLGLLDQALPCSRWSPWPSGNQLL